MRFRTALVTDIPELNHLINCAYRGESSRVGWTTEADLLEGLRTSPEKLKKDIENQDSNIELLFDADEKLQGCVYLRREPERVCYLGTFSVNPQLQGGGYGKMLLTHAETLAKQWHCKRIRMTVISLRDDLIAYYERRGYQRTGAIEPFPVEPELFQWKVKNLTLTELAKSL